MGKGLVMTLHECGIVGESRLDGSIWRIRLRLDALRSDVLCIFIKRELLSDNYSLIPSYTGWASGSCVGAKPSACLPPARHTISAHRQEKPSEAVLREMHKLLHSWRPGIPTLWAATPDTGGDCLRPVCMGVVLLMLHKSRNQYTL